MGHSTSDVQISVSEYIVKSLINHGVKDVFGYPGGMVTYLLDSLRKYKSSICTHICCDERAAAFAACGYAQVSQNVSVAFSTSGPGATNLITGIANAYYDSIPVLFITGQVNTFEQKGDLKILQRGFQETDVVSMVSEITKKAYSVASADQVPIVLNEAFVVCQSDRKGPVLIDLPMDIQKKLISDEDLNCIPRFFQKNNVPFFSDVSIMIKNSKRPCILVGGGIKQTSLKENLVKQLGKVSVPIVSSMIAVDVCNTLPTYYGFIGAYGSRVANFIVSKCDLLLVLGSRLDVRQVGANRCNFAPKAQIIRIDIDERELDYKVHNDELGICASISQVIECGLLSNFEDYSEWIKICEDIRNRLNHLDHNPPVDTLNKILRKINCECIITTDVGQNQVWVAQALPKSCKCTILFSGGLGAMGYAIPSAIGAHYASGCPILCIVGDGGFQMSLAELNTISSKKIPITIILVNNLSLGMIRHFQEMFFNGEYFGTVDDGGYNPISGVPIARAFGINAQKLNDIDDFELHSEPFLYELTTDKNTYVVPKLEYGKPNDDQSPQIDRTLYGYLSAL